MTDAWWDEDLALTIDAYPGDLPAGMRAAERLLSRVGLPAEVEAVARQNQTWYLEPLPGERTRLEIPVQAGWSCFNPSIAVGPQGAVRCLLRSSNYRVDAVGRYLMAGEEIIRTTNYLAELGADLHVIASEPLDSTRVDADALATRVRGFEDGRLFWHDGAWRITVTVRDRNPEETCQIAYLTLDGPVVEAMTLLSGRRRHEKNWMPITGWDTDGPHVVYRCGPTEVWSWCGRAPLGVVRPGPWRARSFSGGSQVVPVGRDYLAVVHEAVLFDLPPGGATNRRIYQHRVVLFDPDMRLTGLSDPFCFQGRGIEFAAGLAVLGDQVVISYGVEDREAWVVSLPLIEVLDRLHDPDPEEG